MTTNKTERYYKLALSLVNGIGPTKFRKIIEIVGSAEEVFKSNKKYLKKIQGISDSNVVNIKEFELFSKVEKEFEYCEKNRIEILDFSHDNYPNMLRNCVDAPPILFFKGNADFNSRRCISIIGTRSNTEYGRKVCEELVEQLKPYNVNIISGLAYGVDAIAHKKALKSEIPTVAVLAHGLDTIYPPAHANLSKEMIENGGVMTEYFTNTKPDKGNFPTRNRIVAGMSEATIVIETDIRGGSMITAELAYSYNRDVFCVPGRIYDSKSAGNNHLIKSLKGQMITNADDIAISLGWKLSNKKQQVQRQLFINLTNDEQRVYDILKENEQMHLDQIMIQTELSSAQLATCMLSLEMQQIIKVLPGKLLTLN